MTGNLEDQTKRTMDGIKQTFDAAGASFKDVVHMFVFRARPQMGDIGRVSRVINSYFAPFNHKPTSTNIAVLERDDEPLAMRRASAALPPTQRLSRESIQ
jgi:enamine deaminase RidA (YjgF/YER057c/UK114 family)